jgi:hypothetical protein
MALGLGLMTLFGLVGAYGFHRLTQGLKQRHHFIWMGLGTPSVFSAKSIALECRVAQFILLRRYKSLDDPDVDEFGNIVFFCGLINIAILICLLVFVGGHGAEIG